LGLKHGALYLSKLTGAVRKRVTAVLSALMADLVGPAAMPTGHYQLVGHVGLREIEGIRVGQVETVARWQRAPSRLGACIQLGAAFSLGRATLSGPSRVRRI
jgi:hypothetical protein